ncbi:hypothetical protein Q9Q95_09175 [Sphingomonas sp. DG1-23]|uniref:hypothetical protein n=1 Tax=Sphingomonas sp. DG1-23 TaxID=3068316 RepID=UPI00273D4F5E|nr:hypothetical protein [Sphingomonas sp. DG1-23]MDP5279094.1 hypothetical protein [Sphingomonas sp. DG1-23]
MHHIRLLYAAPLLLAACSDRAAAPDAENVAATTSPAPPIVENRADPLPQPSPAAREKELAPSPTAGGDGSQIELTALQPDDAERLEGELGCAFAERRGGPALLVGKADVGKAARAFAVVRNGGVRETLAASATGGFGAMEKGLRFGGKGLTVRVTPHDRIATGDESVAQRATLLVQRGDGAERRFEGLWTCGP